MIDRARLDELLHTTGNDPAFLAELIDTYLTDSATLLVTLRQAIVAGDAAEVRRAAHNLKSNSASFGATALSEHCRELEYRARDGVLDGAAERLASIEEAFRPVDRELRALDSSA